MTSLIATVNRLSNTWIYEIGANNVQFCFSFFQEHMKPAL